MKLSRSNIEELIEPFLHKHLVEKEYEVRSIPAVDLLTHERFDLAFKLLYLDMIDKDVAFARRAYKEHIRVLSLGKFTEPGNEYKDTIDKFYEEFNNIFNSIKEAGFDKERTLLPLSSNGSILNGAHRTACAIQQGKDVSCIGLNVPSLTYDYKFFYKRGLALCDLEMAAISFIKHAKNVYLAFVWPSAKGHDQEIESLIPNVIIRKDLRLTPNGAHNLLSQLYEGEKWLGGVRDNYRGVKGKLVKCFNNFGPVRVFAFQADSLEEVSSVKERVREVFNIGKHSIHITDTQEEAVVFSNVAFNENSIHFLNYAKPNKYLSTHRKLEHFKSVIGKARLPCESAVLDGSMVLSAYGIREASDIDCFIDDNTKLPCTGEDIDIHDSEILFHGVSKLDLIYNPSLFFYFNGIKFVSIKQLYKMKRNRAEEKDINDCKMIASLLERKYLNMLAGKARQRLYYGRIKLRAELVDILKIVGLYSIIRRVYRGTRG